MFGKSNPQDGKDVSPANVKFTHPGEENPFSSPLHARHDSAFFLSKWLPRFIQLFKSLVGEPQTTNLPDLNQENP